MSFDVPAEAYDRFMGRYSRLLGPLFADFAGVSADDTVLDVGCGPGALTSELVGRLGAESVAAVDPSETFVVAARERHPGVDVRQASAEDLPFEEARFDATLAQLVVHFMPDPVAGVSEMRRVTRPQGVVAACVWDLGGDKAPLSPFWRAVKRLDPAAMDESAFPGVRERQLAEIFAAAGLEEIEDDAIDFTVEHTSFEEWWKPFTLGVGPAGGYVANLDPEGRAELEELCREEVAPEPFTLTLSAWAARGVVGRHTM